MPHTWTNTHAETCPVTAQRRNLLSEIATVERELSHPRLKPSASSHKRSRLEGLRGAVPEYDNGGDQEVEECDCGVIPEGDTRQ